MMSRSLAAPKRAHQRRVDGFRHLPGLWLSVLRLSVLLASILVVSLLPTAAVWADGSQTGTLIGTVSDSDGVLLLGVEVRLAGPQGARRALTDEAGRFRFPVLPVGSYQVRSELLELLAEQSGVAVSAGRTSTVRLVLRAPDDVVEPALEDWIQVLGDVPLVDRYSTRLGANLNFEFLDDLPVERFYQSFALLLPGVAGGEDGNPNTSGALRSANLFLVDGVDTTDPTTGLFGLNLSYEAVQEVQVTTAASGVEFGRVSGAVINVVTRSGGQDLKGLGRWIAGGDDLTSEYRGGLDRRNLGLEINTANSGRTDLDSTLSLALGGPLRWGPLLNSDGQERLWFFTSYQDSSAGSVRPTLLGRPWNADSHIEATAFKLTWQAGLQNTLVLQRNADDSRFQAFQPFSRGPSELQLPEVTGSDTLASSFFQLVPGESFALEDRRQKGRFAKLQWNAALGQNFSLGLTLADQQRRLGREAANRRGLTADAPHVGAFLDPNATSAETADLLLFLFNGATEEGFEERPRQQANLSLDVFQEWAGVDHEFRFGIDYQETESSFSINVPGQDGLDPFTGLPVSGQLYLDFDLSVPCQFFGVCMPFDPQSGTFQAVGVFNFYDRPARSSRETSSALYLADRLAFDRWLLYLGVRWEGVEGENGEGQGLVDDQDLAPRVAVTYSLGKARKSILSASWGRYYEGFLLQYLDAFQRLEPLSGFTEYERRARVGELDCSTVPAGDLSSPCWQAVDVQSPFSLLPTEADRGLERSSVDEWTLGFTTQLSAHSGLEMHWVDRRWDDLWSGVTRFLPEINDVVVSIENLAAAERSYQGLQLLFRKRQADRWQFLASYTWSDATGNFFSDDGLDTFANFDVFVDTNRVNREGPAPYDRPHQGGLYATYYQPLGQAHLTLGSTLQYRDGVPFHLERLEETGLRFVTPRGSRRLPGVWQWDLVATLDVELSSRFELELRAEVRNLTDEQQQLGAETLIDSGFPTLPSSLDALQTPRTVRLTLGLRL